MLLLPGNGNLNVNSFQLSAQQNQQLFDQYKIKELQKNQFFKSNIDKSGNIKSKEINQFLLFANTKNQGSFYEKIRFNLDQSKNNSQEKMLKSPQEQQQSQLLINYTQEMPINKKTITVINRRGKIIERILTQQQYQKYKKFQKCQQSYLKMKQNSKNINKNRRYSYDYKNQINQNSLRKYYQSIQEKNKNCNKEKRKRLILQPISLNRQVYQQREQKYNQSQSKKVNDSKSKRNISNRSFNVFVDINQFKQDKGNQIYQQYQQQRQESIIDNRNFTTQSTYAKINIRKDKNLKQSTFFHDNHQKFQKYQKPLATSKNITNDNSNNNYKSKNKTSLDGYSFESISIPTLLGTLHNDQNYYDNMYKKYQNNFLKQVQNMRKNIVNLQIKNNNIRNAENIQDNAQIINLKEKNINCKQKLKFLSNNKEINTIDVYQKFKDRLSDLKNIPNLSFSLNHNQRSFQNSLKKTEKTLKYKKYSSKCSSKNKGNKDEVDKMIMILKSGKYKYNNKNKNRCNNITDFSNIQSKIRI